MKISIHLTWATIEIKPWSLIIIFHNWTSSKKYVSCKSHSGTLESMLLFRIYILGHVANMKRENLLCCRFILNSTLSSECCSSRFVPQFINVSSTDYGSPMNWQFGHDKCWGHWGTYFRPIYQHPFWYVLWVLCPCILKSQIFIWY